MTTEKRTPDRSDAQRWRLGASLSALTSLLTFTHQGKAQDPEPLTKAPNVLFIVDTSGSMEYLTGVEEADGKRVEPICDPHTDGVSQKSRWIDLIEVLGGTIGNYRCETVDRRSQAFFDEYTLPSNVLPPDANYRTAYHRPMSGACRIGPGTITSTNLFDFAPPSYRSIFDSSDCSATFVQAGDGLIDAMTSIVRFGLMTLDPLPDAGTGHGGPPSYLANWTQGSRGAFSYFYPSASTGRPVRCASPQDMEVGVRNGAAPAWEGRMVAFGDPEAGSQATLHQQIKQVLMSTRPYGASPVAGALSDAMAFFWDDESPDPSAPLDNTRYYGPKNDRYVAGGCRKQHIILLTDGEPNLDLRPHCEGRVNGPNGPSDPEDGQCPFSRPSEIIQGLQNGSFVDAKSVSHSGSKVTTHIVGFAAPVTKQGTDCTTLTDSDITNPTGLCATNNGADEELEICCTLHEMAYYGRDATSSRLAVFANDKVSLRTSLAEVLSQAIGKMTASATQPVRSPGVGSHEQGGVKAMRLLSSYSVTADGLWKGHLERLRWTCPEGLPVEQEKNESLGDDFNFNISKDGTSLNERTFITFIEPNGHSDRSLRPLIGNANDGLGELSGTQVFERGRDITDAIPFLAMSGGNAAANAVPACSDMGAGDTAQCRNRVVDWALGYAADHTNRHHRCATPGSDSCSVLGDVLHSTPVIVDRPLATIGDESYEVFVQNNNARPMMAYSSTNDGQLHGFMLSPNAATDVPTSPNQNNEKFSFLPPAVLPLLPSQYPNVRLKLLDGVAVVQDVIAVDQVGSTASVYPYKLERPLTGAESASNGWRTILVQSFGEAGSGYFALDITDVNPAAGTAGPRFLWQLTKDAAGSPAPLFGKGGTPLITTLNILDSGAAKEVAVAILPGGDGASSAGSCARGSSAADWSHIVDSTFEPRTHVRCYGADDRGRSLTIVRLDSGEVIRTFRPTLPAAGSIDATRVTISPIDSPITGVPAAYPSGTGAVSDRIFVGDRDGTVFKVDVSNPDPSQWTMKLFFDGYAAHPEKGSRPEAIGQPISTRPTLSLDTRGQITIAFSTGAQNLEATLERQYVWSITEAVNNGSSGFDAVVNWYLPLGLNGAADGEHVLGPLELFGEVLYFSTYTPPGTSDPNELACSTGTSAIYGLHYIRPRDANDLGAGGAPALKLAGATDPIAKQTATDLGMSEDTIIFGVNLEFAPSCYDVSDAAGEFIPGGNRAAVSGSNVPQTMLTFQTTNTNTSKDSLNFQTSFESVALDPPKIASTIQSWAALLD